MDDFKSLPRSKTFESTTIRDIASQIASSAGVSLYYDADDVTISEIEQNRQTDSAFLYSLCETYGLAMKVYNQKIVIFDVVKYEEKDSVLTLHENKKQMLSWSYNTTVEGTYTGVSFNYTDPDTEDTISVTMGESGRMYSINSQASSQYDAELQAAAKVNEANRSIETMEVTIRANTSIVASQCITISDLGDIDGKYYVDKVKHSVGSSGYTMQLTLHKVQAPIKVTAPVPSASSGGSTYTVVDGDTLWGIARKFYGSGTKYNLIYDANSSLIESTAKAHGKSSSANGHWIWAGETFTIPEG
jgi:phage protein D